MNLFFSTLCSSVILSLAGVTAGANTFDPNTFASKHFTFSRHLFLIRCVKALKTSISLSKDPFTNCVLKNIHSKLQMVTLEPHRETSGSMIVGKMRKHVHIPSSWSHDLSNSFTCLQPEQTHTHTHKQQGH